MTSVDEFRDDAFSGEAAVLQLPSLKVKMMLITGFIMSQTSMDFLTYRGENVVPSASSLVSKVGAVSSVADLIFRAFPPFEIT